MIRGRINYSIIVKESSLTFGVDVMWALRRLCGSLEGEERIRGGDYNKISDNKVR